MATDPKYQSGEEIHVGDRVKHALTVGTVVFVLDRAEFSDEFPASGWAYLEKGFMIREDDGTLYHYEDAENHEDIELISRAAKP